ncbi:hypothetical protein AAG589_21000 [Isoptericola sp. F-RaC21]|uniref:hypothetical protein n=1 Tax=Isoptericola sp. F-RaC21 TaxID=3141452 RepID=UPI00315BCA5A
MFALTILGAGAYLAREFIGPMCLSTFADVRRRAVAWPTVSLVAVAALVWLGVMVAVAGGAIRAVNALV